VSLQFECGTQRRINISIQRQLTPRSAWLSQRYVNSYSVLTSQDRHEARYPNVRDFTTHLHSRVFHAAIASIDDCVPLLNGTPGWDSPGSPDRGTKDCESCSRALAPDPSRPDSRDVAFGVAPRINAAGRMAHPAEALAVFEAALDEEVARQSVDRLNQLNVERQRIVKAHFEELVESIRTNTPPGLAVFRETSPKEIAGLSASECVERYSVPSIVRVPSLPLDSRLRVSLFLPDPPG
jgi:single-stranded DNA-specific DHH superfamily exonuclease